MRSKPKCQDVACGVMPSSVFSQPARFGHHVAVQEHDDVVGGGSDAGVASTREPEAQVLLVYDTDVERTV